MLTQCDSLLLCALQVFHIRDQLCWLHICGRREGVMEQTTSNNPVIWHSAEFQEPIESALLLTNHFLFFLHSFRGGHPWTALCVMAPKKLTLYFYYYSLTLQRVSSTWKCSCQLLHSTVKKTIIQHYHVQQFSITTRMLQA